MKFKRILASAMSISMLATSAFAVGPNEVTDLSTDTGYSDVILEVMDSGGGADVIIVEVPAELPIVMDQDGNITVPTNANIINHTQDKGVKVSAIEATIASGWTAAEYTDDFTSKPDDTKEMGLSLRSDNMGTNGAFSLSEGNWVIDASGTLPLDMGAKFPKQTTASKSKVATIGFTFDWDDGNGGGVDPNPDPEPSGYDITIGQGEHGTVDNTNGFKTNSEGKIESFPSTTPDQGYIFDHWEDENGNVITTDTVFDKDTMIKPVFIQDIPDTVTVTFTAEGNGTIQGNTVVTINKGERVTFPTAVPESIRYELSDWVDTATNSSIEPTTPIDSDTTIKAVFAARPSSPKNWFTTDGANTITGLSAEYLDLVDAPTDLVIPNNIGGSTIKSIGANAFKNKDLITSIVIPNTVTVIGGGAFTGCSSLTELNLEYANIYSILNSPFGLSADKVKWAPIRDWDTNPMTSDALSRKCINYNRSTGMIKPQFGSNAIATGTFNIPTSVDGERVTGIGEKLFLNNTDLTKVVIPSTITTIDKWAFQGCKKLTSVDIPNSVTTINESAFQNCIGLTSIRLPNSLTTISNSTFYGCEGLTEVIIPSSVTTIESHAFSYCTGMKDFVIPSTVKTIYSQAFYSVPHITYYGTATGSWWGASSMN